MAGTRLLVQQGIVKSAYPAVAGSSLANGTVVEEFGSVELLRISFLGGMLRNMQKVTPY